MKKTVKRYYGRKAVNELRRRGVETPDALTYKELVKMMKTSIKNLKNQEESRALVDIELSQAWIDTMSATTKKEQNRFLKEMTKLMDDYNYTMKDLALTLNKVTYKKVTDPVLKEKQDMYKKKVDDATTRELLDTTLRDMGRKEVKSIKTAEKTKIARKRYRESNVIAIKNLNKSIRRYPDALKELVEKAIEFYGEPWLIGAIKTAYQSGSGGLGPLEIIYSSDEGTVSNYSFTVYNFFKLTELYDRVKNSGYTFKDGSNLEDLYNLLQEVDTMLLPNDPYEGNIDQAALAQSLL